MSRRRFQVAASRRTFLKTLGLGAAGAFMSPMLSRLEAEACGQMTGRRVVFVVEGNGFFGWKPWTDLTHASPQITAFDQLPPNVVALQPYLDRVTLVNGLANKQGLGQMSGHFTTHYTLGCMPYFEGESPGGISIDAYLAQVAGANSIFPHVRLGAAQRPEGLQVVTSASGPGQGLLTQHDPAAAFVELFGAVTEDISPEILLTEGRMMLDFMTADIQRIIPRLAPDERWKFERYLQAVEGFQTRQQRLADRNNDLNACAPEAGPVLAEGATMTERLEAQFDLASLALTCGLTRVVTLSAGSGRFCHDGFHGLGFVNKHNCGHGEDGGAESCITTHN